MPGPQVRSTTRADGDFAVDGDPGSLERRRRGIVDRPWTWLRQVHGGQVVVVTEPGEHAGTEADAAITMVPGAPLAISTADCVPLTLFGGGALAVAHVGWRGLMAGVVEATVDTLREQGGNAVVAVAGPSIGPECYEFGVSDLDAVAGRYGDRVRARTSTGAPALDLIEAIGAALVSVGVHGAVRRGGCTACQPERYFSNRARRERERMATVAWMR